MLLTVWYFISLELHESKCSWNEIVSTSFLWLINLSRVESHSKSAIWSSMLCQTRIAFPWVWSFSHLPSDISLHMRLLANIWKVGVRRKCLSVFFFSSIVICFLTLKKLHRISSCPSGQTHVSKLPMSWTIQFIELFNFLLNRAVQLYISLLSFGNLYVMSWKSLSPEYGYRLTHIQTILTKLSQFTADEQSDLLS